MAYISYIAALVGIAGIAGGLDKGSWTGTIAAAVLYMGGVVGMAASADLRGGTSSVRDECREGSRDRE